jgi:hypothetical protein
MSETMGFPAPAVPLLPHPRRFPPPHGLCRPSLPRSGIVPAAAVRTGLNTPVTRSSMLLLPAPSPLPPAPSPLPPAPSPLPAVHAAPAIPATARLPPSQGPNAGPALTRLISRSTPYLTFLQHQHLLSVSPNPPAPSHPRPAPVPPRAPSPPRALAYRRPTPRPCPPHPGAPARPRTFACPGCLLRTWEHSGFDCRRTAEEREGSVLRTRGKCRNLQISSRLNVPSCRSQPALCSIEPARDRTKARQHSGCGSMWPQPSAGRAATQRGQGRNPARAGPQPSAGRVTQRGKRTRASRQPEPPRSPKELVFPLSKSSQPSRLVATHAV